MSGWPHAPPHHVGPAGVYMVTAATLDHVHHLGSEERLDFAHDLLLETFEAAGWALEAWCVLANHYHLIARSPESGGSSLGTTIGKLHTLIARDLNRLDGTVGRQVWHNFRDSHLTNDKSYLARLHYVHANAVHHGLVRKATDYRWCSAAWFERLESPARVRTVYSFPVSKLIERDEPL